MKKNRIYIDPDAPHFTATETWRYRGAWVACLLIVGIIIVEVTGLTDVAIHLAASVIHSVWYGG